MKYPFVLLLFSLLSMGCSDSAEKTFEIPEIRIVPRIESRASSENFEYQDVIGLSVLKNGESYFENQPLMFDGSLFSSVGMLWYADLESEATLAAYYPYQPSSHPFRFSISTDQRGGCEPSDLLGALLPDVLPSFKPIEMIFHHLFAELNIVIENRSGKSITEVVIGGFVPTAEIDLKTLSAVPVSDAPASDVIAYCVEPDERYQVVLVPQQADLAVSVRTDDGEMQTRLIPEMSIAYGETCKLRVTLTSDAQLDLALVGDIVDWGYGGAIDGDETGGGEQKPDPNVLTYAGETYRIKEVNGKIWMAENLRYVPAGATLERDYWYPDGNKADVAKVGLLYPYRTAVGGTIPAPNGTAPIQGICPDGWRIPTSDELWELATAVPRDFFDNSGFYRFSENSSPLYIAERSLLISSTVLSSGRVHYLRLEGESSMVIASLLENRAAASLRCIKN